MKKVPFLPLTIQRAKLLGRHYLGWGESFSKFFPGLDFELQQARIPFEAREWLGIGFFGSLMYFLLLFGILISLTLTLQMAVTLAVVISLLVGFAVGGVIFLYFAFFPKLHTKRKIKNIENNLPYALNHMLIQVRSGVTLFQAIVSIAWSNYGLLSEEFKKTVSEINTGKSEINALERLARDNPSMPFRRILWQMVNALKSGSDIGLVLKSIVENIASEQKVAIKRYGSTLNPLALFYMMLVVIFPTLGIVFILILFSFVGATINIQVILLGILGFLVFVQIMFMGLVKNKRPTGI